MIEMDPLLRTSVVLSRTNPGLPLRTPAVNEPPRETFPFVVILSVPFGTIRLDPSPKMVSNPVLIDRLFCPVTFPSTVIAADADVNAEALILLVEAMVRLEALMLTLPAPVLIVEFVIATVPAEESENPDESLFAVSAESVMPVGVETPLIKTDCAFRLNLPLLI